MNHFEIHQGDSLVVLKTFPPSHFDSIVTDPPYGLEFMGREWDAPWKSGDVPLGGATFSEDGMGKGFKALPSYTGSPNPNCLNCKGSQRGNDLVGFTRCKCDAPSSPNVRSTQMRAFQAWCETWAVECLRVLKPGGHIVAFGGTRTFHRLTCALEDSGFEIRDNLCYLFGTGFPKSLDVGKAIGKLDGVDKAVETEIRAYLKSAREDLGMSKAEVDAKVFGGTTRYGWVEGRNGPNTKGTYLPTPEEWPLLKEVLHLDDRYDAYIENAVPSRELRARIDGGKGNFVSESQGDFGYQGEGRWSGTRRETAPATDEAKQWDGWGTALKPAYEPVILARKPLVGTVATNVLAHGTGGINIDGCRIGTFTNSTPSGVDRRNAALAKAGYRPNTYQMGEKTPTGSEGRWPSNVMLDETAAEALDEQTGVLSTTGHRTPASRGAEVEGTNWGTKNHQSKEYPMESGGASRFFYTAKASKRDRQLKDGTQSLHPTVKPESLMRWLCRLVTPPGGLILDCFNGSGSTGNAALLEGFRYVGIEREEAYVTYSRARLKENLQGLGQITSETEDVVVCTEDGATPSTKKVFDFD